ncbi:MAG: hypothetical protein P8R54_01155 [Myxococcota bacterium]|nr:hypothetical protein [Myxococcota bacterium]
MKTRSPDRRPALVALLLGVIAGWAMLWLLGGAFVLTNEMGGYGWPGYVLNGWLAQGDLLTRIDTLRTPLHPLLLGNLGEHLGSYADAGILISSLSCALAVLCAGLGAAALSGGWAGGLAALATGMVLGIYGAPSVTNQYPLLAGLTVSAVGLSAVASRLPGLATGLLAGGALGLCMAAESRGVLLVPAAVALVGIGMVRSHRWGRLRLGVGFALALSAGLWMRATNSEAQHARMVGDARGLARQAVMMDQQRAVIRRWVQQEMDIHARCVALSTDDLLTTDYLTTDCAAAVLTNNLTVRIPRHLPLGAVLTVSGLLLLLLPTRDRRGAWAEGVGAGLLAGSSVLMLAVVTPMPPRYVIQQAPLLVLIGAAGAGRLAGRLPAPLPGLAMAALTGWVLSGGWDGRARADRPALDTAYDTYAEVHRVVGPMLGEHDRLIDCADLNLELALLPRRVRSGDLTRDVPLEACAAWIERPEETPGETYILVRPGRRLRGETDVSEAVAADGGWEEAAAGVDWALWRSVSR